MSPGSLCRLCISSSQRFKSLLDDTGQLNGIYKIAVKYFDPLILTTEKDYYASVICIECWQRINDFHTFQQSVINSQTKLNYIKPIVLAFKLDEQLKMPQGIKAKRKKTKLNAMAESIDQERYDILISTGEDLIKCQRIVNDTPLNDIIPNELSLGLFKNNEHVNFLNPISKNIPEKLPWHKLSEQEFSKPDVKKQKSLSTIHPIQGHRNQRGFQCSKCEIYVKGKLSFKLHMLKAHNMINQECIEKSNKEHRISKNLLQTLESETNTAKDERNTQYQILLNDDENHEIILEEPQQKDLNYEISLTSSVAFSNANLPESNIVDLTNEDVNDRNIDSDYNTLESSEQCITGQNIVKSNQPISNIILPELDIVDVKNELPFEAGND